MKNKADIGTALLKCFNHLAMAYNNPLSVKCHIYFSSDLTKSLYSLPAVFVITKDMFTMCGYIEKNQDDETFRVVTNQGNFVLKDGKIIDHNYIATHVRGGFI